MPTPAEEVAFLTPIRAQFRRDFPRMIYADYLDESPDPSDHDRAEFIRLQLTLAKLPHDHLHRGSLTERQNELLLRRYDEWTRHLRGMADGFEFHRGMIDSVSVSVNTFAAKGEELFRLAPIRRVRFVDAGRMVAKLVNVPLLARVRELMICNGEFGDGGLNVLLRSPHLKKLRTLDLSFCGLSDGGVRVLSDTADLPRLQRLLLNDNQRITSDGMKQLAASESFGRLRVLDVSGNDIDGIGIDSLASCTTLTDLRTLRLRDNRIGDQGCHALARSQLLARMLAYDSRLELRHNVIEAAGVVALTASSHFAACTSLDLSDNPVSDGAISALVKSEYAKRLTVLCLRSCGVNDSGAVALARSRMMRKLRYIDVSSNKLTRRGIDELWRFRRNWHVEIICDGNVPGVSGPSDRVRTRRIDPPRMT